MVVSQNRFVTLPSPKLQRVCVPNNVSPTADELSLLGKYTEQVGQFSESRKDSLGTSICICVVKEVASFKILSVPPPLRSATACLCNMLR